MEISLMIDTHQADHNTRELDNQLPDDWFCGLGVNDSRYYGSQQRKYSFCVEGTAESFIIFNYVLCTL